ncbi:MAG TPA: hypothetical protein VEK73_09670, partial [Xanthobacteraceae bacterium]|nr:hypothetical protein [Xanthobacteraceae bacterium]
ETGLRSAHADKIPEAIVTKFRPLSGEYTVNELRRELISGCCVDKRDAATIYFPHRSFQEFLVSEYLAHSRSLAFDFKRSAGLITPLIGQFLLERADAQLAADIESSLAVHVGPLSWEMLCIAARITARYKPVSNEKSRKHAWLMYVQLLEVSNFGTENLAVDRILYRLGQFAKWELKEANSWAILALLHCCCWMSQYANEDMRRNILRTVYRLMMAACPMEKLVNATRTLKRGESHVVTPHDFDGPIPYVLIGGGFRIETKPDGSKALIFSLASYIRIISSATKQRYSIINLPPVRDIEERFDVHEILDDPDQPSDIGSWQTYLNDADVWRKMDVLGTA